MYTLLTPKSYMYNRVESRPRTEDFDRALKAEIADPLWLLSRQWQFGEMKGEDTGSSIFAKVKLQSSRVTHLQSPGSAQADSLDPQLPLEAQVEALKPVFDQKTNLQFARYWKKILQARGLGQYLGSYQQEFPLTLPAAQPSQADTLSNAPLKTLLKSVAGKTMNALEFYSTLKYDGKTAGQLVLNTPADKTALDAAGQEFLNRVDQLVLQPSGENPNWLRNRLEYQVNAGSEDVHGEVTVLKAEEHYHGDLDWYTFDINPDETAFLNHHTQAGAGDNQRLVSTLLPSQTRFPGMPASRWWEFEDGRINFGQMDVNEADLGQLLLTQFGLMYSNDWCMIPFRVPVGSLCEVEEIVVTDVFGQKTLVRSASALEPDDAIEKWGMFNLSTLDVDGGPAQLTDGRLLIPATPARIQESKPVEQVKFIRDEMANMVWGVEKQISDGFGGSQDGYQAGQARRTWLYGEQSLTADDPVAGLKYELVAGDVPENWIPFLPAKVSVQVYDQIRLQRGKMKRKVNGLHLGEVEPKSALLADKDPTGNYRPLFLEEAEVPRLGTAVKTTWQRARWYNGKVVVWMGRKKQFGHGEGSSGLRFDEVTASPN